MNLQQRLTKIEELQAVKTPWEFSRIFGDVQLFGAQFSVYGSSDGDFVSIDEAQKAIEWLVNELGGTIKWGETSNESKITGKKK